MKVIAPIACIVYALLVVFIGKFLGMSNEPSTVGGDVTLDKVYSKYFKQIVKDGGGQYVGIQEVNGGDDDLILFNSHKTGSTLAVKTGACTSEAVATKLALHEDRWDLCNSRRSSESKTAL